MVRIEPSLQHLLVDIDSLHQHPDNPNNGDLDGLIESIRVNGFYSPIVVDAHGEVIAGNHRYQAMISLGEPQIPAIRLNVDREQALRILLVDNKITRDGSDDTGLLMQLLEELQNTELGLIGTGWDVDEAALLALEGSEGLDFGSEREQVELRVVCETREDAVELAAELADRGYQVTSD